MLDLGATAKALAADRAARAAAAAAGGGVLVSLGGDVATGGPAPAGGWRVHVPTHPRADRGRRDGADRRRRPGDLEHHGPPLAARRGRTTSSTRRRARPRRPRGAPSRVAAATCVDANIASTAAIVLGAPPPAGSPSAGCRRAWCGSGRSTSTAGWPAGSPHRRAGLGAVVPRARHRRRGAAPAHGRAGARRRRRHALAVRRAGRASSSTRCTAPSRSPPSRFVAVHVVTQRARPVRAVRLARRRRPVRGALPAAVGRARRARVDLLLVLVVDQPAAPPASARARGAASTGLAYACWPVALVHALGTGSDTRAGWMLAVTLGCVGPRRGGGRSRAARPGRRARPARAPRAPRPRLGAALAARALWLPSGPLAEGWARRAGTPAALLARPVAAATPARARAASAAPMPLPFEARGRGRVRSGIGGGRHGADRHHPPPAGSGPLALDIRLAGSALPGGGVSVARSQVTLGPASDPARYAGRARLAAGTTLDARVDPVQGRAVRAARACSTYSRTGGVTASVRGRTRT